MIHIAISSTSYVKWNLTRFVRILRAEPKTVTAMSRPSTVPSSRQDTIATPTYGILGSEPARKDQPRLHFFRGRNLLVRTSSVEMEADLRELLKLV
mmetsp:Transcript_43/g.69  ORF Transcript_43/g.69 Transcript_43/m.69 type:complete len:96 (-) Transcript_43:532-819(-)